MSSNKPIVWLPGAGGQVGQALMHLYPVPHSFEWYPTTRADLDLSDLSELVSFLRITKADTVVNCAAFTDVNGAETHREEAEVLNAQVPELLFDHFRNGIHISTNYVFPSQVGYSYSEAETASPGCAIGVYGETKRKGEVKALQRGATVIRTSWVYGPRRWGGVSFYSKIAQQIEEGKKLRAVTDEVGNPTSSLTLARGIVTLLEAHFSEVDPLKNRVLHLTDQGDISRYEFTREIARQMGYKSNVNTALRSDFPSPVERPESSLLKQGDFGLLMPLPRWEEALREIIDIDKELVQNNR